MATTAVREARRSFVGREGELATLTEVSGGEVARVLYLHGVAGIGKSALLGVFLDRLRATGASVVYLDCRTVEPTERGCLAAAGQVDTVDALVAQLGELPQPVLLVLDHYELFRHLREREGRTVSRPELLREVWGTEFTGGSNVVDAVARSLRHKLGPAAMVVETVRGSGYRLRPDWRAHLR
jgi:hypothetical protein